MNILLKTKIIASLSWRGFELSFSDYISLIENIESLDLDKLSINTKLKKWVFENKDWVSKSIADLSWCDENNINVIYLGHNNYPKAFLELPNPPKILSYIGVPCWNLWPCISVVGSRNLTNQCSSWLGMEFSNFVKSNCINIVSGGAVGADQMVHKVAILNSRPTVVFLPSGFETIYPNNLKKLVPYILKTGGAVISQFEPKQIIFNSNFHRRNRLIAAISKVVFILEASRRSGTLITAREALTQGKKICVLPSFPNNKNSLGALDLIYDGAQLIRDSKDLQIFTNI